jgi:hypothetical protein
VSPLLTFEVGLLALAVAVSLVFMWPEKSSTGVIWTDDTRGSSV